MRADIADFIVGLHVKDQKNLLGRRAADVEAIERHLPGDAEVYALLDGGMRPQDGDMRVGVVALTSSGVQWSGRGHFSWPWEQIQLISGASNYRATILLVNNEKVRLYYQCEARFNREVLRRCRVCSQPPYPIGSVLAGRQFDKRQSLPRTMRERLIEDRRLLGADVEHRRLPSALVPQSVDEYVGLGWVETKVGQHQ